MKRSILALLCLAFAAATLHGQGAARVATLNMQRVMSEYEEFQQALKKVEGAKKTAEEDVKRRRQELQQLAQKVKETKAKAENEAMFEQDAREKFAERAKEMEQRLKKKRSKFQSYVQSAESEFKKTGQKSLQPLQQNVAETARKIAKERGANIILPLNSGAVLWADESFEITDAVIEKLNNGNE